MSLYDYIQPEFQSLFDANKSDRFPQGDPNLIKPIQWQTAVLAAIKNYIESTIVCHCSYSGIIPPSSPDPVVSDNFKVQVSPMNPSVPSDYSTWLTYIANQLALNTKITQPGIIGIKFIAPTQVIIPSQLNISQDTLVNKTLSERWNFIGDSIVQWISTNLNTVPAPATNPSSGSTGTAQILNIL